MPPRTKRPARAAPVSTTYDARTAARVREALAGRRGVAETGLMGSLAFMVGGALCCAVGRDGLLVRIAAADREALLARPHVAPMALGARTMRGFVRVAPAGYRTAAALAGWLELGVAAAAAAKRRAKPAPTPARRGRRATSTRA